MSLNVVEKELIESEETYVKQLNVLISSFLDPLEKYITNIKDQWKQVNYTQSNVVRLLLERVILDEDIDIIATLFANIKAICSCNSILLASMKAATLQSSSDRNAMSSHPAVAVLLKHLPFIKIYASYAANFEKSNALLTRLEKGDARYDRAYISCSSFVVL